MKKREYHRANNFNKRTILVSNVILFVVLLIVVRLTQVQLFNYETYEKKAIEQIRKMIKVMEIEEIFLTAMERV